MHRIIEDGINNITFCCEYDINSDADLTKDVNGVVLCGRYGKATTKDDAYSIIWFDDKGEYVYGEIVSCCANCEFVGRSGGGFFAECEYRGFTVNNEFEHCCKHYKTKCLTTM